jgi:REP element-mobilizing transposase RayT
MRRLRKSSVSREEFYQGRHRFEHWYLDNCVYFITARCRDKKRCFASEEAKGIFWERFEHYARMHHFVPWATTLMDNHYHTIGYLKFGEDLGPMMRKIHGSVAKMVNDLLPVRVRPFWYDSGQQGYFDGCIRDEKQARRAYRYILKQAVRAGIVMDWHDYPHTRIGVELEQAIARAKELKVFLEDVPYQRYSRKTEELAAEATSQQDTRI